METGGGSRRPSCRGLGGAGTRLSMGSAPRACERAKLLPRGVSVEDHLFKAPRQSVQSSVAPWDQEDIILNSDPPDPL